MAWDFSTEPEFEAKLEWMRAFLRDEIFPLEVLDLNYEQLLEVIRPLQEEVKRQGLWAAHLPPDLGGMGFGQVKLGLMHEVLGQSPYGPVVFGNNAPDSGNAELLAVGIEMSGREDQRTQWLQPLLDGELRSAFSMTEPNTAGSDPTLLSTRAVLDGEEYVINGHKWYTSNGSVADFLVVMAVTNPDVHPYQGSSMFIVPVDTPGVDIVRDVPSMEDPAPTSGSSATMPRSVTPTSGFPPPTSSATREPDSSWPRPASARAASTTACAGSASRGGPSTCCVSGPCRATPTARRWRRSRPCRTGWRTRSPRCMRRGS